MVIAEDIEMLYIDNVIGFENLNSDGILGLAPKPSYLGDPDVFTTKIYEAGLILKN